jgi:hypothetical protein
LAPPLLSTKDSEVRPTSFDAFGKKAEGNQATKTSAAANSSEPGRFEPSPAAQPLGAPADAATRPAAASAGGSSIQFTPPKNINEVQSEFHSLEQRQGNQPTLAPPLNPAGPNPYRTNKVPVEVPSAAAPASSNPYQSNPPPPVGPKLLPPSAPNAASPLDVYHDFAPATIFDREVEPVAYYAQLQNAPPARRAQDLVATLYITKAATNESTKPVMLEFCLSGSTDRRRAVAAYWKAAEYDVRRSVAFQTLEQLENLKQTVLRFRDTPAGSVAMLRVEAAKFDADALRLEAGIEWITACFRLTEECRRPLDEAWLSADTPPHAGAYTATAGQSAGAGPRTRRAAERIPATYELLQLRAQSVVAADTAVDFMLREYSEGRSSIHGVLHAVDRRRTETGDLSAVVTRYNLDIADYALSLLPDAAPRDTVAAALVVRDLTAKTAIAPGR